MEWFAVTAEIKGRVAVSLSEVAEIQREMQERMLRYDNMDTQEVDTLRMLQAFVEKLKVALPSDDVSVEVQVQADSMEETSEAPEVNEHDKKVKYEDEDSHERAFPEEEPSDNYILLALKPT